jgi:ribosomal protein L16 Arg81 hydroxylase
VGDFLETIINHLGKTDNDDLDSDNKKRRTPVPDEVLEQRVKEIGELLSELGVLKEKFDDFLKAAKSRSNHKKRKQNNLLKFNYILRHCLLLSEFNE